MGGVFGIVMSSFEFAGPQLTPQLQELSTRQQMKIMLKDMGSRSYSSAKNFAVVAAIFSSSECFIEGVSFFFQLVLLVYCDDLLSQAKNTPHW